ncbi:flagellar biosynthetic protein FliR [Natronincola ferrireducens]|uniref:Flagellar biosynthetic protein FliR n=1 Tax=Natronincola ferrireducens TaxID=393762 RepID=A0A1G9C2J3_9FIRM|nr:flagellar biosynthetic protein FliR [Natronincola ferrireducens]SDK45858.1 flagellar biosynthetic protein FliR [Natronincola ferrireducens]
MENIYTDILANINLFFLILVRVSGIFVIAPIFGRNNLPVIMKVGLSALISFILLPIISSDIGIHLQQNHFFELTLNITKEFLLGVTIGFICFLYFSALYLAGTIIDTQIGFAMVNVLDPQLNTQMPIMANYYNILVTLIFLILNGHHFIIRGLVYSYELLPIGFVFTISEGVIYKLIDMMMEIFVLAFQFSAPILATIFLANVLLGILARTMPQMNVFIVGLPLKIFVGILTILVTLQFLIPFSQRLFDKMFGGLYEILQLLSKG